MMVVNYLVCLTLRWEPLWNESKALATTLTLWLWNVVQDGVLGNQTLAAHGLEEHVQFSLIFAIIVSFMLFTVFTLANVLYSEEFLIHDSGGFMILKNN